MPKNPNKFSNFTVTSGRNVGRNANKIIGCEHCNFMMALDVFKHTFPPEINPRTGKEKKTSFTGRQCPRCQAPTGSRLFDSKAEFIRHTELQLLLSQGHIEDLEYQPRFDLNVPDFETGEPVKIGTYVADFGYFSLENQTPCQDMELQEATKDYVLEDVKNKSMVISDVAKMKITHFEAQYGIPVTIVGR